VVTSKVSRRSTMPPAIGPSGSYHATSSKERRVCAADAPFAAPPAPLTHKLIMATAVILPFLGCLTAIVVSWRYGFMGWPYLALLVGGWLASGLGITVGFHRLLTHRSFETYGWVRMFWMALGALSVEGSPLVWCAVHRRHHEFSDLPGDPHSPHLHGEGIWGSLAGLWYAHAGWLFTG
jgi:stearoyl-CoA desaturase (delta-9 desaturase)